MATKFSLTPNPTFKADVEIPVPGGKTATINFTFKHKTRDEFKAFTEGLDGRGDAEIIQDIAAGWGLDDAFNDKNIEALTQNYLGAGLAIVNAYVSELAGARKGN